MKLFRGISPALILLLLFLAVAAFILEWIRTPEHHVPAKPPQSTDMAVLGGTTAALLTAYHGAQNGAQVYLFPQGQELGHDAPFLLADGLAAPMTPPQQELEETYIPEKLRDELREKGAGMNDPALLDAFIQFSPRLFPPFEEINDTVFFDYLPDPERRPYLHLSSQPLNPDLFVRQLQNRVMSTGVIISNDQVQELIFSPEGSISGLLLEKSDGKTKVLKLRSVVLADGGYSGDPFSWHPYLPKGNMLTLRPEQEGLGLRFAANLGMDVVQTGFYRRRILLYSPVGDNYCFFDQHQFEDAYFFNTAGQLLHWPDVSKQQQLNFIHMSPDGDVYLLVPQAEVPEDCAYLFHLLADWESLARYCGGEIPSLPLAAGETHPIAQLRVGVDYTAGGLAVTTRGELKRDGSVVEGLYAAGEICGGLHGEKVLPGMPLSETIFTSAVSGAAAAEHAWR